MQRAASASWGKDAWWHPGGLAWNRPTRIAFVDGTWVWVDDDTAAVIGPVTTQALRWATEAGARRLTDHRQLPLPRLDDAPFFLDVRREAAPIPDALPSGLRLGVVEDVASFVDCHRRAWNPHHLPFASPQSFPVDATSSFDEDRWTVITQDPLFDPSLVIVGYTAETPVGSCIAWLDPATAAAEIEPLGVIPEVRGRGVARLLVIEAINRLAGRNAREIVVRPRGDDNYPAPRALYASCGFMTHQRNYVYRLDA
jgi:ribosomal protein S18 acetylase RimI-like enzyme